MTISSASCSTMLVMSSVSKKIRLPAAPRSTAGPSPFALTTVLAGTRAASIMTEDSSKVEPGSLCDLQGRSPLLQAFHAALKRRSSTLPQNSFGWVRSGEIGAARFFGRFEFHEFDAGEIGIEEIELPLPVPAHLGFLAIVRLPSMRLEKSLRLFHVGDTQRNVIEHAHKLQIGMLGMVQHVFEPVGAIGDLHGDPVGLVGLHAAVPVEMEAKKVTVEMIFGLAAMDQKSDVDHVAGDGRMGRCGRLRCWPLDELNMVAFRIGERDCMAFLGPGFDCGYSDVVGEEIFAKGCDIICCEGDVIHAVGGFGIGRGTVAHPLFADQVPRGFTGVDRFGGGKPECAGVKLLHAVGSRCIEGNVINTENTRASRLRLRVGSESETGDYYREENAFHGVLNFTPAGTFNGSLEVFQKLTQEFCDFFRSLPGRVVAGFRDHAKLAAGDMLVH